MEVSMAKRGRAERRHISGTMIAESYLMLRGTLCRRKDILST
jgi:hypothetical protein